MVFRLMGRDRSGVHGSPGWSAACRAADRCVARRRCLVFDRTWGVQGEEPWPKSLVRPDRRVQRSGGRVASGDEIGLQVAVVHEGRMVVDAAAGVADRRTGEPVTPGTLFFAASTGKGMASSVTHVLAERGELAYDERVADVWPEFGAHGKDVVTLADGSRRRRATTASPRFPA